MSSGNAHQERLQEELDAAIQENAPTGKLEDAEIQRLVQLSNDASYQRSERIPVKTVEAFEPRSLVSIAMAAQRRRESELAADMASREMANETAAELQEAGTAAGDKDGDAAMADQLAADDANAGNSVAEDTGVEDTGADGFGAEGDTTDAAVAADGEAADGTPSSTSQVDFEAGRAEGIEEGHRAGFDEGQAKGMEEGRAAGRAEASAQLERAVQAFEAATARLTELTAVDSGALGKSINEAILRLASERAGRAIVDMPDSFANRIEALLATIRTVSGQPSIKLNPADLSSIQPLVDTREKLRHCNFVADEALAQGDLSVMIGTIGIDDIMVPCAAPADNEAAAEAKPVEPKPPEFEPIEAEKADAVAGADTASKPDMATDDGPPQTDGDQDD